jgi:hypothetical protein
MKEMNKQPAPSVNIERTEYMSKNTITAYDICTNHLFEVNNQVDKAVTLMNVIIGNYFESSEDALKKDELLAFLYKTSYAEIQSLLFILSDYVWAIKKGMEAVMEADIVYDKVTA